MVFFCGLSYATKVCFKKKLGFLVISETLFLFFNHSGGDYRKHT